MSVDRRRHMRVVPDPARPVEVQIMGPGFLEIVDALNVSVGGIGVFIPHGLDVEYLNKPVEVILTLPRCRPVHLRGIIRHLDGYSDPCHLGVEFARLTEAVQAALERFVAANQHRPYEAPPAGSGG
jgi:hypothetical protein